MKITDLFVKTNLCKSKKEAKRLIQSGGAKINDVVINDANLDVVYKEDKIVIGTQINDEVFMLHSSMIRNK